MVILRQLLPVLAIVVGLAGPAGAQGRGILLLAHGGSAEWNGQVSSLAADVDKTFPTEVAFGMATRANIQAAADRLKARGATSIVAVPLFVSSWSSVITSTEYLLGQRAVAPPQLAMFAAMDHSAHGAPAAAPAPGAVDHAAMGHGAMNHGAGHVAPAPDPTSPIDTTLPVHMTSALNDHPIVADILASRARSISRDPAGEAVIIAAHGPVADAENEKWLADMKSLAARVGQAEPFASIDYLTLRDDAPEAIRNAATAELRTLVSRRLGEGRRVLIVPLLVSYGGIEKGLRERLEGLDYTMPAAALVPDARLVDWVLAMARE